MSVARPVDATALDSHRRIRSRVGRSVWMQLRWIRTEGFAHASAGQCGCNCVGFAPKDSLTRRQVSVDATALDSHRRIRSRVGRSVWMQLRWIRTEGFAHASAGQCGCNCVGFAPKDSLTRRQVSVDATALDSHRRIRSRVGRSVWMQLRWIRTEGFAHASAGQCGCNCVGFAPKDSLTTRQVSVDATALDSHRRIRSQRGRSVWMQLRWIRTEGFAHNEAGQCGCNCVGFAPKDSLTTRQVSVDATALDSHRRIRSQRGRSVWMQLRWIRTEGFAHNEAGQCGCNCVGFAPKDSLTTRQVSVDATALDSHRRIRSQRGRSVWMQLRWIRTEGFAHNEAGQCGCNCVGFAPKDSLTTRQVSVDATALDSHRRIRSQRGRSVWMQLRWIRTEGFAHNEAGQCGCNCVGFAPKDSLTTRQVSVDATALDSH